MNENKNAFDESLDSLRADDLAPKTAKKKSSSFLISTVLWCVLAATFLGIAVWSGSQVIANLVDFAGAREENEQAAIDFSPVTGKSNKPDKLIESSSVPVLADYRAEIEKRLPGETPIESETPVTTPTETVPMNVEISLVKLAVEGVSNPETRGVYMGGTFRLIATVYPVGATEEVFFYSDGGSAVSLDAKSGEFSVFKTQKNSVTFYARTESGRTVGELTVPLRSPVVLVDRGMDSVLTINDSTVLYPIGVGESLTASVLFLSGQQSDVEWSFTGSALGIAANGADCTLTGKAVGRGTVTARVTLNGESYEMTIYIDVPEVPVPVISLYEKALILTVGERYTIGYGARNLPAAPTFRSSDTSVVTVDASGTLTAVSSGSAKITLSCPGTDAIDTCLVTVVDPEPPKPSVSLREKTLVLNVGEQYTLTFSVSDLPADPAFRSSSASVVTVDSKGTLTAISAGSAKITLYCPGTNAAAACIVEVVDPTPPQPALRVYETGEDDPLLRHDKFISYRDSINQMRSQFNNNDIFGWIYIPHSNVDYPLVRGKDNDYYLNHNHKKDRTNYGSIYLDYRCDTDLRENQMSFIYGHNVANDSTMFNFLIGYKRASLFNNEKTMYFYIFTETAVLKYQIFSAYVDDKTQCPTGYVNYPSQWLFQSKLQEIKNNSINQREGIEFYENDRIVMLYTCAGTTLSDDRLMVFGVLVGIGM